MFTDRQVMTKYTLVLSGGNAGVVERVLIDDNVGQRWMTYVNRIMCLLRDSFLLCGVAISRYSNYTVRCFINGFKGF